MPAQSLSISCDIILACKKKRANNVTSCFFFQRIRGQRQLKCYSFTCGFNKFSTKWKFFFFFGFVGTCAEGGRPHEHFVRAGFFAKRISRHHNIIVVCEKRNLRKMAAPWPYFQELPSSNGRRIEEELFFSFALF